MTPAQIALARARTYGFVAEVLLDGWTDRALAASVGLPIAPFIPHDADVRDAHHQQVFGRAVPPYESVFRSPKGLLGGDVARQVRDDLDSVGFHYDRTDVEPDHAGLQCAALSFLCAAEADAHRDRVPTQALQQLQTEFIRSHLGRWLPLLHRAVAAQGRPECTELTGLLMDLVQDHAPIEPVAEPFEDVLANPKHGLKDVARYLLAPARCGVWLGAEDIQRVADRAELACGFGRRPQMMESLWFSAVDHQRVPDLVEALTGAIEARAIPDDPRVGATLAALRQLASAVPEVVA